MNPNERPQQQGSGSQLERGNPSTTEVLKHPEVTQETNPQQEVRSIAGRAEAAHVRLEAAENEREDLARTRARLHLPEQTDLAPNRSLEEARAAYEEAENEKREWRQSHPDEEFPEDVPVATSKDGDSWEMKIQGFEENGKMTVEERAEREEIVAEWKNGALKKFSELLKNHVATRDAVNLEAALIILKTNLPVLIDKAAKPFIEGEKDMLPAAAWLHFKGSSFFDRMTNKPSQIKELKLNMDEQQINLATPDELDEAAQEEMDAREAEVPTVANGANETETAKKAA